ncbi:hypothetical protein [Solwaraspora sp. WMMA2065]|uniref:hypothetical protein n=1 Tax=Solwaraspora sp. WMMA2065 TaxID=3015166 RepID=UPI00259BC203|nr:hypothetical protein [Solwaraspora sp. WMMA2065]WJK34501.1 hypothetical protein O7610_28550 [Solwaraspora sp. WMMA2065]
MSQHDPVDPWADVDPAVVVTGTPTGERSGDVGIDSAATEIVGVSHPGPGDNAPPTRPRRPALLLGALGMVAVVLTIATAVAFANRSDEIETPGAVALTGEPTAESSAGPADPATPDPAAPSPGATPSPTASQAGPDRQAVAAAASPGSMSPAAPAQPATGAIRTGAFVGATRIGSQLNADTTMYAGEYILSPDGRFGLLMQTDGNLVAYGPSPCGAPRPNICQGPYDWWASNTNGQPGSRVVMQSDGNLVIYRPDGSVAWASNTKDSDATRVMVTNQGHFHLARRDGSTVMTLTGLSEQKSSLSYAGTMPAGYRLTTLRYLSSPNEVYHLMQQQDGNLVLYGPGTSVLWSSGTHQIVVGGMSVRETRMQPDGNLVVYDNSAADAAAVWASDSVGAGPSPELVLRDDGNLVLRSGSTRQVFWQTGTGGQL